jgi:hypothetical protein
MTGREEGDRQGDLTRGTIEIGWKEVFHPLLSPDDGLSSNGASGFSTYERLLRILKKEVSAVTSDMRCMRPCFQAWLAEKKGKKKAVSFALTPKELATYD